MNRFSNDADVLRFEPAVFAGAAFAGPVLCKGSSGQISGTTFTAAGENFLAKQIQPGQVIYLSDGAGAVDGAYEIVRADSSTQLTISVLRADPQQEAIPVGTGSGLFYRIGTFDALADRAGYAITQMLGIRPGAADSEFGTEHIADSEPLRDVSAMMVLVLLFTRLYQDLQADAIYLTKREQYQNLADRAAERVVVKLDPEGDGIYEKTLSGGKARLVRE